MSEFFKKYINFFLKFFGLVLKKNRKEIGPFIFLKEYNIKTVIDVGANIGQFASEIRAVLPNTFIYSFEPMKECFSSLVNTNKEDKNFKAFNFALGDSNCEMNIKKNSYAPSSSILDNSDLANKTFPYTKDFSEEKIVIKTLDSISSNLKIQNDVLLKIDVQGFEKQVLIGADKFLDNVKFIIIENSFFELYKGQALFDEIYNILNKKGFSYFGGLQTKKHPESGRILFEDSLFIRRT